jgi:hypothetical protein
MVQARIGKKIIEKNPSENSNKHTALFQRSEERGREK